MFERFGDAFSAMHGIGLLKNSAPTSRIHISVHSECGDEAPSRAMTPIASPIATTLPTHVLRTARGLVVVLNRRRLGVGTSTSPKGGGDVDWSRAFESWRQPLGDLVPGFMPGADRLTVLWERLGAVRLRPGGPDANLIADTLELLLRTGLARDQPRAERWMDPLRGTAAATFRFCRASARVPRHEGPSPQSVASRRSGSSPLPLRPARGCPSSQRALATAQRRVASVAWSRSRCPGTSSSAWPGAATAGALDRIRPRRGSRRSSDPPPGFAEEVLPLLSGAPWSVVQRLLSAWRRQRLEHAPGVRAALARILATRTSRVGYRWVEALSDASPSSLPILAGLVASSPGIKTEPSPAWIEALARIDAALSEKTRPYWLDALIHATEIGRDVAYVAGAARLAELGRPPAMMDTDATGFPFDVDLAENLLVDLEDGPPKDAPWTWHLIGACGTYPGFTDALHDLDIWRLEKPVRAWTLWFLCRLRFNDRDAKAEQRRWRALRPVLRATVETLRDVPRSYLERAARELDALFDNLATPDDIRLRLAGVLALAKRVCRPPHTADTPLAYALGAFAPLPKPALTALLTAPDESFLALAAACRRENDARLVTWGLAGMRALPDFLSRTFRSEPRKLYRAAKALGALSFEERQTLVGGFAKHALLSPSTNALDAKALCRLVAVKAPARRLNPIPRALSDWAAGERTLRPAQIERHRLHLLAHLDTLCLDLLEISAIEAVTRPVGGGLADGARLHAAQLLRSAEQNRRPLRKYLAALANGDQAWLARHPRNRAWFVRHPRLDESLWTAGIELRGTMGGRNVTLSLEQEPFEILRLGTYVGSCLGLGGSFSHSAAAVLLDANKQVVYARDARQAVVGRQILAISEDDQLIAYHLYPAGASPDLAELFRRYDQQFARRLGVPLLEKDPDAGYEVALLVAHDWWDDGVWVRHKAKKKAA